VASISTFIWNDAIFRENPITKKLQIIEKSKAAAALRVASPWLRGRAGDSLLNSVECEGV
jgi:hypothetical protein